MRSNCHARGFRAVRLLEAEGGFDVVLPEQLVERLIKTTGSKQSCPLPTLGGDTARNMGVGGADHGLAVSPEDGNFLRAGSLPARASCVETRGLPILGNGRELREYYLRTCWLSIS